MSPEAAGWIVTVTGAYFAFGSVFALLFAALGVGRMNSKARGSGWGFRLLILPGAAALWPFLTYRWLRDPEGR